LDAQQVTAGYRGFVVIREVSAKVSAGRVLALLGPNGSGKSTFAKAILSISSQYGGSIRLAEQDISTMPTHAIIQSGVSYIPQSEDVFPSLTVEENIEIPCIATKADVREALESVYERMPTLYELRHRRASQLSGGERRMVAIGRALANRPKLIVADEPSSNLAPAMADRLWQQLRLIAESGVAILAVEQNVGLALEYAHSMSILVEGQIRLHDEPIGVRDISSIFDVFTGTDVEGEAVGQRPPIGDSVYQ
jgi:ABC-type branched-subunit amino acid transport system ATPase component